jgi:DNA-directed RNA polymerase specialized sigma24 family protein
MPQRLPDTIRNAVIESWLKGYSRDKIATECRVSTGAVSSIVYEWTHNTG